MKHPTLEDCLENNGKWGKFQIYNYFVLSLVVIFSVFTICYIFTARDINHRCLIAECENSSTTFEGFKPKWLKNYVPHDNQNIPARCSRYQQNISSTNSCFTDNSVEFTTRDSFEAITRESVVCDTVIYEHPNLIIANDFGIQCDENLWKLTIVGSLSVTGEFISDVYTGYFSDTFGRKKVLLFTVTFSTIMGIIKSFSVNYIMYIICEFLDTALSAGKYVAAFILAMEIVGQKGRSLGNTILSSMYAVGEIFIGLMAWYATSWRTMLRILYFLGFPTLILVLTLPESIKWLMTVNRRQEIRNVLKKIYKTNRQELTEEQLDKLLLTVDEKNDNKEEIEENKQESLKAVLTNKTLFLRILHCSFTWICCTFGYYGLTIHSVAISENIYLSFIFSAAIEIPANFIYCYTNERYGRRKMMFITMVLGGISCISVGFLPEDLTWMKLPAYLTGKACLTIAFAVLYVLTTELFPTHTRHRIFSICSMCGRFGMMMAPQVPLLARISPILPMLMFGTLSLISGLLALNFPETANTKLPDTIEEAVNIGRNTNSDNVSVLTNKDCEAL